MSDKGFFRLALGVSIAVFAVVVILNRRIIPAPEVYPSFVTFLPTLNAIINSVCSVLLIFSLMAIRNKKVSLHKKINITTFILSAIFLISYVVFHFFIGDQHYPKDAPFRTGYLIILTSHIILAAIVLPLILMAFYHALKGNISRHKKIVRYTYPVWLYVTVTGVVVYLLISPHYTF
ncbi:MAG: DUF420 domain-containing protein [Bacteroidetes bacterium]|nr:DUF420 domain-containing protein [Bacteroidota bacterium]